MANLKDLLVNGPSNLIGDVTVNKIRLTSLEIPTSSNGTEYGTGSNGKILKSNGTSVYWSDFSGDLTGNAATATKLQTARTINGTSFDGSANITTANWGTQRTLKIGNNAQQINGSTNYTWKLRDIQAGGQWHVGGTDNCSYVLITINHEQTWMCAFTLRLYQGYTATDIQISGYNYNSVHWYSPKAIVLGSTTTGAIKVYFGYTGNLKLWVAVDGGNYTGADIFGFTNGYTQIDPENAFTITKVGALPETLQETKTVYRPWYRDETVATASKLSNTSKVGDTNKPVYFTAGGVPSAINYTIEKSVPSDAVFTDRYVNSASFSDDSTNISASPLKMTLTRAGSDTTTVTANIPKVSSSSAGVVPKGTTVDSQSQSTKFLREDGSWAVPSYTTNTDTKNTAGSTDTSSKIFLIGATTQAANPQTYSDNQVYVTNGTLYLTKTTGLSGIANNKPALIVGGSDSSSHMEFDADEIQAKTNATTTANLYINNDGGLVTIGSDGLVISSLTASQAIVTDSSKKLTSRGITNNSGSACPIGWVNGATSNLNFVTVNSIAYWDGCYGGTGSNLAHLKGGYFDTNNHFIPKSNVSQDLGNSNYRWSTVYAKELNLPKLASHKNHLIYCDQASTYNGTIGVTNYIYTTQQDGDGVIIPHINNDLAFLLSRNGTVDFHTISSSSVTDNTFIDSTISDWSSFSIQESDKRKLFNGSLNYYTVGSSGSASTYLIIDIKCPTDQQFRYYNYFYIDFQADQYNAKNIWLYTKNG